MRFMLCKHRAPGSLRGPQGRHPRTGPGKTELPEPPVEARNADPFPPQTQAPEALRHKRSLETPLSGD